MSFQLHLSFHAGLRHIFCAFTIARTARFRFDDAIPRLLARANYLPEPRIYVTKQRWDVSTGPAPQKVTGSPNDADDYCIARRAVTHSRTAVVVAST